MGIEQDIDKDLPVKEPWATPNRATPKRCYRFKQNLEKPFQQINPTIQNETQHLNKKQNTFKKKHGKNLQKKCVFSNKNKMKNTTKKFKKTNQFKQKLNKFKNHPKTK